MQANEKWLPGVTPKRIAMLWLVGSASRLPCEPQQLEED
jgi:hypothetical protein